MKRTVAGIYLQTVLFHILIVAVEQEMKFLSCMSQFSSIISTNGTCANHSVFHIGHKGSKYSLFFCIFAPNYYYLCRKL